MKKIAALILFLSIFINIYSEEGHNLLWSGNAFAAVPGDFPHVGFFISGSGLPKGALVKITNSANGKSTNAVVSSLLSGRSVEGVVVSNMAAVTLGIGQDNSSSVDVYLLLSPELNRSQAQEDVPAETEQPAEEEQLSSDEDDKPLDIPEIAEDSTDQADDDSTLEVEPEDAPEPEMGLTVEEDPDSVIVIEDLPEDKEPEPEIQPDETPADDQPSESQTAEENQQDSGQDNDSLPEAEVQEQEVTEGEPEIDGADSESVIEPELVEDDSASVFEVSPLQDDSQENVPEVEVAEQQEAQPDDSADDKSSSSTPDNQQTAEDDSSSPVQDDAQVQEDNSSATSESADTEPSQQQPEVESDAPVEVIEFSPGSRDYDSIETDRFFLPAIDEGVSYSGYNSPGINFLVEINGRELALPRMPEISADSELYRLVESRMGSDSLQDLFTDDIDLIEATEGVVESAIAVESLAAPEEFSDDLTAGDLPGVTESSFIASESYPGASESDSAFNVTDMIKLTESDELKAEAIVSNATPGQFDMFKPDFDMPEAAADESQALAFIQSEIFDADSAVVISVEGDVPEVQIVEADKGAQVESEAAKGSVDDSALAEAQVPEIEIKDEINPVPQQSVASQAGKDQADQSVASELQEITPDIQEDGGETEQTQEVAQQDSSQEQQQSETAADSSSEKYSIYEFRAEEFKGRKVFFLQIGAYSDLVSAEKAAELISTNNVPVKILRVEKTSGDLYKVLIGPLLQGEKGFMLRTAREMGFRDSFYTEVPGI